MALLEDALGQARELQTWAELMVYLRGTYDFWQPTEDNVRLERYGWDRRIGWDTWLLTIDGNAAMFTDGVLDDMPCANILGER